MNIHIIITCVAQKNVTKAVSILDEEIKDGSVESVFGQWRSLLTSSKLKPLKAIELYKGTLWNKYMDLWGLFSGRVENAKLWIISAGHGFIGSEETIIPYDITFQDPQSGISSLYAKVKIYQSKEFKKEVSRKWWELLAQENRTNAYNSITKLIKSGSPDDKYIIVAGKDYIGAVYDDLNEGIRYLKNKENLVIISNNVNDPLLKTLRPHWLNPNKKFANIDKTNSTAINASIANNLFWNMFLKGSDLSWWSIKAFNQHLELLAKDLREVKVHDRERGTDEEVKKYIINELNKSQASFSKLHRAYRDSGKACESKRFKTLYNEVKEVIKEETRKSLHFPKVIYKNRSARMSFFLPDWNDRVDPIFDFVNEESLPFREPYEHDKYHYELYGSLSCDGILVSKSVLEKSPKKKELARSIGIHKYLRLPSNVPVLGDCGAFNYAKEYLPPFNTNETLQYYHELGFDYGVSIDHMIVPDLYTDYHYYKRIKNDWINIEETEFNKLRKLGNARIVKSRKTTKQYNLFEEKILVCKEKYEIEGEKERRYNLTLQNGYDFIKAYKKKSYSFIPVGAVQGWNPETFAEMVKEFETMGYEYVAIGGVAKANTNYIIKVLEKINEIKKNRTKLHVFGVARPDAIDKFLKLGVTSVDNAGVLTQAWQSGANNYFTPEFKNYSAIRIPQTTENKIKKLRNSVSLVNENVSKEELKEMESDTRRALELYDKGEINLENVLKKVTEYNKAMGIPDKIIARYERTLKDKPWQKCPCRICQETGIEVIIFRGNNRNRRRGFHNTWVYYNWFKSLTGDVK